MFATANFFADGIKVIRDIDPDHLLTLIINRGIPDFILLCDMPVDSSAHISLAYVYLEA